MRTIERSNGFKRDFKREAKGPHRSALATVLPVVITDLAHDKPLAAKYMDHGLTGGWSGYRDCHIKPDLVLIYSKPDPATLRLVRLGSHSEVFE